MDFVSISIRMWVVYVLCISLTFLPSLGLMLGHTALLRRPCLWQRAMSDMPPDFGTYVGEEQFPMDPIDRYPENEADAAMIEAMREERMISNDRWQSTSMRDTQGGQWKGSFEVLRPVAFKGPEQVSLSLVASGTVTTRIDASPFQDEGVTIFIEEDVHCVKGSRQDVEMSVHPLALTPSRQTVTPEEWRLARGNQIVGNAFTTGSQFPEVIKSFRDDMYNAVVPDAYIAEVCAREGKARSRVRFIYTQASTAAVSAAEAATTTFDLHLAGIVIIRELQEGATSEDAALIQDMRSGMGIYDQQVTGDPYVVLNLPGRLSLCFPRAMRSQSLARNILTMEWTAKELRYQVDRKFGEFTGLIRSLELTEIGVQDSETFYPGLFSTDLK